MGRSVAGAEVLVPASGCHAGQRARGDPISVTLSGHLRLLCSNRKPFLNLSSPAKCQGLREEGSTHRHTIKAACNEGLQHFLCPQGRLGARHDP